MRSFINNNSDRRLFTMRIMWHFMCYLSKLSSILENESNNAASVIDQVVNDAMIH